MRCRPSGLYQAIGPFSAGPGDAMSSTGFIYEPPRTLTEKLGQLNWLLLVVVCMLAGTGLVALYSVAGGSWSPWAERHAVRFLAGLALLLAISVVPLRVWSDLAWPVYLAALALLALVPVLGTEALGARRWLSVGGFSFQPAELMKLALVAALARYYQGLAPARISHPFFVLLPVVAIALPVVLTARQPDLGSAALLALIGLGLLLMAGVHVLYFAGAGAGVLASVPYLLSHLHDYQRRRLDTFLDPGKDPLGAGYHITQSKIALGSGGVSGKGFLGGTQSQLDFLPEKHTDFIFTTIGEEWGFVGTVVVLALFGLLLTVLAGMAIASATRFARLLVVGATLTVFGYAAINVSMVTGLVPVVGVPLPFVSYGGTSMLTLMFGLGLAMCAWVHRNERGR